MIQINAFDFICLNCGEQIPVNSFMGTKYRNHCPNCLWSKHVDSDIPGDRKSNCGKGMRPIGLTLKHEGKTKGGTDKIGELMIVHICSGCEKININRIAADDNEKEILKLMQIDLIDERVLEKITHLKIDLLTEKDRQIVETQLFGKEEYR
jgi:hypothetical protein